MTIADLIRLGSKAPMRFLLIGGWAVGLHGHSRVTIDVDFLVRREDKQAWMQYLLERGLKTVHETNAFAQFSQPNGPAFDLMFVNGDTFEQMWVASIEKELQGSRIRIPTLNHLLALKLHALKQNLRHRTFKDADDVEMLVRKNGLDLTSPEYEALFMRYGNRELYETFRRIVRN